MLDSYTSPHCCALSQVRKGLLLVQDVPVGDVKQGAGFGIRIYPRENLAERSDNGTLVMVVDAAGGGAGDDKSRF
jgi:hypothetical protein